MMYSLLLLLLQIVVCFNGSTTEPSCSTFPRTEQTSQCHSCRRKKTEAVKQSIVSKICHLLHAYYITMSPIFTFYFQSGRVGTATKPLPYARLTTTAATTFKNKEAKRYRLKKMKRAKKSKVILFDV